MEKTPRQEKITISKKDILNWKIKRKVGDVTKICNQYTTKEKKLFPSDVCACLNHGIGTQHTIDCINDYYSKKKA